MGWFGKLLAVAIGVACAAGWLSLLSWSSGDPSLNYVATGITRSMSWPRRYTPPSRKPGLRSSATRAA